MCDDMLCCAVCRAAEQEFFSVQGFLDFFGQLLSFYATPSLETPTYTVLR